MSSSRLKEQDEFIQLIRSYICDPHDTPMTVEEAFEAVQSLLDEHYKDGIHRSVRLHRLCPNMGRLFSSLNLVEALQEYDIGVRITKRKFVPPSFKEIRQVINIATVRAVASSIRLLTLDADDTIYNDGCTLKIDSPMVPLITKFMRRGIHVSLVTAASYPGEPHRYEQRLAGLLSALAYALEAGAPDSLVESFHVMGGQCNYLLRAVVKRDNDGLNPRVCLEEVPDEDWKNYRGVRWDHNDVHKLLDHAQNVLEQVSRELTLDVTIIRKERAVGVIAANSSTASRLTYEVLEELALAVQHSLTVLGTSVPHCVFNGGHDCFVDIGHKALGITALQGMLGIKSEETIHVGDRFTRTGNDLKAREVANTLWVDSPVETEWLLTKLLNTRQSLGITTPTIPMNLTVTTTTTTTTSIDDHNNGSIRSSKGTEILSSLHPTVPLSPVHVHNQPSSTRSVTSSNGGESASSVPKLTITSPSSITSTFSENGNANHSLVSALHNSISDMDYHHHPVSTDTNHEPSTTQLSSPRAGKGIGTGISQVSTVYGTAPVRTSDEIRAATLMREKSFWEFAGGHIVGEIKGDNSHPIENTINNGGNLSNNVSSSSTDNHNKSPNVTPISSPKGKQ